MRSTQKVRKANVQAATNRLAAHLISFVPLCFVENVSGKTSWTALECVFVCEDGQGVASDSSAPPRLCFPIMNTPLCSRDTQLSWTTWEERRTHACAEIEEGVTWHLFIAKTLWLHLRPKKQHLQPELLRKHLLVLFCTQSASNEFRAAEGFLACRNRINSTCVNIL